MIFALLLAGMSFATSSKVEAQETAKVAAGGGWSTWHDYTGTFGGVTINIFGCWGAETNCYGA